jgi:hypothetical protein
MQTAPTSTSRIRPGIGRRTTARMVSVLAFVADAAMISVSPASALPRACDTIGIGPTSTSATRRLSTAWATRRKATAG